MSRPDLITRTSFRSKAIWLIPLLVLILVALVWSQITSVEEPKFTVVQREGAIEIREYPATVVAEVRVTGDQKQAASKGFRLLAGYIFGGNTRRQSIAMTAPVAQTPANEKIAMTAPVLQTQDNDGWLVRFTMPAAYTIDTLPKPNDAQVILRQVAPARYAAIRFSGLVSLPSVAAQTVKLLEFVRLHRLSVAGPASLAQYNPPWTLWFLRRNEVMIELAPTANE